MARANQWFHETRGIAHAASSSRRLPIARTCLAIVVLLLSGCATTPPQTRYPDETERAQIGRIAIICPQVAPPITIEPAASGKGAGAARGAGGAVGGLWEACSGAGEAAIFCAILTPFVAIGGTIYGGASAPAKREITAAWLAIEEALAELDLQSGLNAQTLRKAQADWPLPVTGASLPEPSTWDSHPDYRELANEGIDTVLEVAMTRLYTEKARGANPPLVLVFEARSRLVSAADGREIYRGDHFFRSRGRRFLQWGENDAAHFRKTFELAIQNLATNIIENALFLYPLDQRTLATDGAAAAAPADQISHVGLRPLYPVKKRGFIVRKVQVDSLQPTLRWEAFPRAGDLAATDSRLVRARNIRYELRLARAADDFDDTQTIEAVYRRDDLLAPQHTVDLPLKPGSRYFWSVRARFELDGITRVTPWAGTSAHIERTTPIPSRYSHMFHTPRAYDPKNIFETD